MRMEGSIISNDFIFVFLILSGSFIVIGLFICLIIYFAQSYYKKRTSNLKTIAQENGYIFHGTILTPLEKLIRKYLSGNRAIDRLSVKKQEKIKNDLEIYRHVEDYLSFNLFHQGYNKYLQNCFNATKKNLNFRYFDYQYTTGSGKSSHTWYHSITALKHNSLKLPGFMMKPENIFHKIGQKFGMQDIDFTDYPNFSSHYLLKGEEISVRSLFNHDILDFFQYEPGFCLEGNNEILLFYKTKFLKPDDIKNFINKAAEVFQLFMSE